MNHGVSLPLTLLSLDRRPGDGLLSDQALGWAQSDRCAAMSGVRFLISQTGRPIAEMARKSPSHNAFSTKPSLTIRSISR